MAKQILPPPDPRMPQFEALYLSLTLRLYCLSSPSTGLVAAEGASRERETRPTARPARRATT